MERAGRKKVLTGLVVGGKMRKTAVVLVERTTKHPLYGKIIRKHKKFYAHDENEQCRIGDRVRIVESRPLSRLKRWRIVEIVERGL
ncbi:MAG: 30S ribosomal protein S17 [bacterium]